MQTIAIVGFGDMGEQMAPHLLALATPSRHHQHTRKPDLRRRQ